MTDFKKKLNEMLLSVAEKNASDFHLSPGYYPTMRVDGRLIPITDYGVQDAKSLDAMAEALLDNRKSRFDENREADFSYELSDQLRFRVNVYMTRGHAAIVFRLIPQKIKTLSELNMPASLDVFTKISQGFVLIVGPNGHGKSSTMAALVSQINNDRAEKIITLEDPIEYLFVPEKCIIDQRELFADTLSFSNALRAAVRENVNVLMIGEMRDYETMSAAVSAAETGHLVFASLHTNSAAQTVQRIVDSFPPDQQPQIITQLADTLSGIVSQRLIPRIKGGLIPAAEVLIANPAVRNLIREGKFSQLNLAIDTGSEIGMLSLNRSLADLVHRGEISIEQAQFYSLNPSELQKLL